MASDLHLLPRYVSLEHLVGILLCVLAVSGCNVTLSESLWIRSGEISRTDFGMVQGVSNWPTELEGVGVF